MNDGLLQSGLCRQRRAFALVLALLLTTILGVTGGRLAFTTAVATKTASWRAKELDHRLAAESFARLLSQLLAASDAQSSNDQTRHIVMAVGELTVIGRVTDEKRKKQLNEINDWSRLTNVLRSVAGDYGLPAESIRLQRPWGYVREFERGRLHWFDQVLRPQRPDEMFVIVSDGDAETPSRTYWSDHVTVWDDSRYAAVIHTIDNDDRRRWYVVVDGAENVLFLSKV